ncbi:DUF3307 domain-containing protein [Vibrio algarum]|uniref:DUF3307 domain-containing protein n=1 Tax=Vibrio algarum TaxID=3020714 RepID=A0ABT4YP84_9VIBR|nr:DUF3307 domain-containing protein [Vibrio sp. KJ40-1]MDB1123368.1 DUF3307 domain-containing protein [Vibrio sp. KJ40-1]
MSDITLLMFLILGHVACDFYFQPDSWVKKKNEHHHKSIELLLHSALHGIVAASIFYVLNSNSTVLNAMYVVVAVSVIHYATDLIKSYSQKWQLIYFLVDQLVHIGVLIAVWLVVTGQVESFKEQWTIDNLSHKHALYILAYIAIFKPASVLISMILKPWTRDLKPEDDTDTLKSAGQQIGYFERFLMLTFILLSQYSVIGFLLAAKSVFRFGDLTAAQDKKLTEYVMLGTLASVTVTISIGLFVIYTVGKVTIN